MLLCFQRYFSFRFLVIIFTKICTQVNKRKLACISKHGSSLEKRKGKGSPALKQQLMLLIMHIGLPFLLHKRQTRLSSENINCRNESKTIQKHVYHNAPVLLEEECESSTAKRNPIEILNEWIIFYIPNYNSCTIQTSSFM